VVLNSAPEKVGKEQELSDNPLTFISLSKGKGTIRSIGKKFSENPVTGTASMAVRNVGRSGASGFWPKTRSKSIYNQLERR
jgi:hypothetical protein